MANVRLLAFSYTYAITEKDDPTADMPKEVEESMQQVKLGATGAYMPTPVPPEDRSNDPQSDAMDMVSFTPLERKNHTVITADTPASTSSAAIPLREIERVLPIYLRVYYKEDNKTKRSIIEYEVKNTETLIEMLSVMLRKLKFLKGKSEAKGRMYFAQRKFRNPAELDFKRHASTVIEDLSQMEKSLFFVFDMAGRLDAEEAPEESAVCWTVPLRK